MGPDLVLCSEGTVRGSVGTNGGTNGPQEGPPEEAPGGHFGLDYL